ncbi:UPF0565 protein C2orf69 homolog isoform X4 [Portunus trituberculatus]|uniref:UPF0565 protein C2orf69 homolog isoform X4 n=1 Tax=Portunus trituberculatus TaxID=210409 RepID=UPI001E1CC4C2|nr:UPF0565 protein C2orf69 homolog isoform X4 [Portunus trituberculatus]
MVPNKVGQLLVGWCLTFARKMSHSTQAVLSPVRLGSITTPSGQANEAIYVQPSKASANLPIAVLVFFGGDVQDYPEVMAAHRDHKNYVDWSLTSTATLLASKFPAHHVLVIKPSRMERKTFSCYDNFVSSNNVGAPTHEPRVKALSHLATLIPEALRKAHGLQTSTREEIFTVHQSSDSSQSSCIDPHEWDTSDAHGCGVDIPHWFKNDFEEIDFDEVILIGFSKGCVVLNQIITELHALMTVESLQNKQTVSFIDKVRNMYWLDGGHAGGRNTWITSHSILKSLAAQQQISIHIHVTPYQVLTMPNTHVEQVHNDVGQANPPYNFLAQPTTVMHYTTKVHDEFRPWIGKECKSFYDILKRAGAKIDYLLHFGNESPSLLCHFRILNSFI